MAQSHKVWLLNRLIVGSIFTRWSEILHLYFHFFALVSWQSAALSSATQHTMLPEFGGKWGMECFNTRFPLPILLCAGYSVKQIFKILVISLVNHFSFKFISRYLCELSHYRPAAFPGLFLIFHFIQGEVNLRMLDTRAFL